MLTWEQIVVAMLLAALAVLLAFNPFGNLDSGDVRIQAGAGPEISSAVGTAPSDMYVVVQFERDTTSAERLGLTAVTGIVFEDPIPEHAYYARVPAGTNLANLVSVLDGYSVRARAYELTRDNKLSPRVYPGGGIDPIYLVGPGRVMIAVEFSRDADPIAAIDFLGAYAVGDVAVVRDAADNNRWLVRVEPTDATLEGIADNPDVRWIDLAPLPPEDDAAPRDLFPMGGTADLPASVRVAQWESCPTVEFHPELTAVAVREFVDPADSPLWICRWWYYDAPPLVDPPEYSEDMPLWTDVDGDGSYECRFDPADDDCGGVTSLDNPTRLTVDRPRGVLAYILNNGTDPDNVDADDHQLKVNVAGNGLLMSAPDPHLLFPIRPLFPYLAGDHATFVAGIVARQGASDIDNGIGYAAGVLSYGRTWETETLDRQIADSLAAGALVANASYGQTHHHDTSEVYSELAEQYDSAASGYLSSGVPNTFSRKLQFIGSAGNRGPAWGTVRLGNTSKNTLSVGNLEGSDIETTSSRGPTKDGRLAPLIAMPGTDITSTYPQEGTKEWFGTSFSTPVATGMAAHLVERYTSMCTADPDPSTMRGLIVHSATDLTTFSSVGANLEGPDFVSGYGEPDMAKARDLLLNGSWQTQSVTRGYREYQLVVDAAALEGGDLRVTLVWDDPPFTSGGALLDPDKGVLHNDLDLELVGPDGTRYLPWVLDPDFEDSPATRQTRGRYLPIFDSDRDRRNTVEQVVVPAADLGSWRIRVRASSMRFDAQSFSLVSQAFAAAPCTTLPSTLVEKPLEVPDDWLLWFLFWVGVAMLIILFLLASDSLRQQIEDDEDQYLAILILFLILLAVFLLAFYWEPIMWLLFLLLVLVLFALYYF